jgi:CRISPR type I-E-associated protein CasB/Cse2
VSATKQYIETLERLKPGELALLRIHTGQKLDRSVDGFDLFSGLWWPLRERNERAPRREVAWLIAKLYAFRPIPHSAGNYLAQQLGSLRPRQDPAREPYRKRFDRMLSLPIAGIEPALQWALDWVCSHGPRLDWVKLTDDLSRWERESIRLSWAEQFLQTEERKTSC